MVLINDNSSALSIGDTMPHFTLPATDGMEVDSTMIKDPFVAVIFTCNHCPYAQKEERSIKELMEECEQTQFVLISSNDAENYPEDSFDRMKVKKEEAGWSCEYCYDESQDVAKTFGALCTPHCFLFNKERELVYKGCVSGLENAARDLEADRAVAVPEDNAIGCSIKWKASS